MTPPPYPRIPYLWPPHDRSAGDRTLTTEEARAWLRQPVVVEEKLDGANVTVWADDGRIHVAPRGGPGAMDRSRQLGRLRAWCAERDEILRPLLTPGLVVYGEWLWLRHSVHYTRLPDWLVVLDVWDPHAGFLLPHERDDCVRPLGLCVPPILFRGVLRDEATLAGLLGPSAFADEAPAEGVVCRTGQDRCKVVADSFVRRPDEQWGDREHNALA